MPAPMNMASTQQQQQQQQPQPAAASSTATAAAPSAENGPSSTDALSLPNEPSVLLVLLPEDPVEAVHRKMLELHPSRPPVRIGRVTSQKSVAQPSNGFFDSKVLSRQHAEICVSEDGRVFICDVGSSNGTFINDNRLSAENERSAHVQLKNNDKVDFGVNIYSEEDDKIIYKKATVIVRILPLGAECAARRRFINSFEANTNISVSNFDNNVSRSTANFSSIKDLKDRLRTIETTFRNHQGRIFNVKKEIPKVASAGSSANSATKIHKQIRDVKNEHDENKSSLAFTKKYAKELPSNADSNTLIQDMDTLKEAMLIFDKELAEAEVEANKIAGPSADSFASIRQATISATPQSRKTNSTKRGSGIASFLFYLAVFVCIIASLCYFVANNSELRESSISYFKEHFNMNIEPALKMIQNASPGAAPKKTNEAAPSSNPQPVVN